MLPDNDKTVVITGASRGLGAGMADALATRGFRLALCARSPLPLAASQRVMCRQLDVCDGTALDDFAKAAEARFGRIHLWINNAGVLEPISKVRDLDQATLDRHFAINVGGVLNGSKTYLSHLERSDGAGEAGVLINISSGAALKGYAAWGAYCASKAAVDRLSECLQLEEADLARVYAVAPGVIDTAMQTTIRSLSVDKFPMVEKFRQLKRDDAFNTPKYVADKLIEIAFSAIHLPASVVCRLPNMGS